MKWSFYLMKLLKYPFKLQNDTHRSYISNDENPQMFHEVKYLQNQLKNLIERCQEKYYLCISKIIDGSDDKS